MASDRVFLDTNIVAYLLADDPARAACAEALLDGLRIRNPFR